MDEHDQALHERIVSELADYANKHHGPNRYNTPWRAGADGGTLALDLDPAYALGIKWYDHKTNEGGNGLTLAKRLGIPLGRPREASPPAAYASLDAYAAAHGVDVEVFAQAGWHEVKRARNLLAFAFPTDGGMRYRYADESKAGRKYDHDKGNQRCWYGLLRAVAMAKGGRLYLCNGEVSTLVAQAHGIPACALTGGEHGSMPSELSDELAQAHRGPVAVVFDSDEKGATAGPALATHLRALGFDAVALDLGGSHGFDLADLCRLHREQARDALERCPVLGADKPAPTLSTDWRASGTTAARLQFTEFPPEVWVFDSILPTGACLLAAKPKKGKSWLALQAAVCKALGLPMLGRYTCTSGRVLYIDVEGTQRRIKKRLRLMLGANQRRWPDNLHIFTEWPQGPEALTRLEEWLLAYPDTSLVIIDVLGSFRRPMDMRESFYQYDRETVKPINDLVERYDCAALLIHHLNKAKADDVFETISGSTGLISVTNTQWAMGTAPDDRDVTILSIQGRDIENIDPLATKWDDDAHAHRVVGSASEIAISIERKAILDVLNDDQPHTPRELAEALEKPVVSVKRLLGKMLEDGQVDKTGRGQWVQVCKPATAQLTPAQQAELLRQKLDALEVQRNASE